MAAKYPFRVTTTTFLMVMKIVSRFLRCWSINVSRQSFVIINNQPLKGDKSRELIRWQGRGASFLFDKIKGNKSINKGNILTRTLFYCLLRYNFKPLCLCVTKIVCNFATAKNEDIIVV